MARPTPTPGAAPATTPPRVEPLKVRATRRGYYDDQLRHPGDVFVLADPAGFADMWMEHVAPDTPESVSGPNRTRRDTLASRAADAPPGMTVGDDTSELPTGDRNLLGE